MKHISSRDNPQVKALRRLAQDKQAYREQGRCWLEGEHLVQAWQQSGRRAAMLVLAESLWQAPGAPWTAMADAADDLLVLADAVFASVSGLESPARLALVVDLPAAPALVPDAPAVVLDRLQDAGNVGAILRCAAAFGFAQVLALKGSVALWSPKVLRAGMGAHASLHLVEGLTDDNLQALRVPKLATSSHGGPYLHELQAQGALPWPCAWLMGHEGQGVSERLMAQANQKVRIVQPGGQESLNVATAAAICLHASAVSALARE